MKPNEGAGAVERPLLTKGDVAKRLNVHVRSVDNFVNNEGLPIVRIGKTVRFRWSSVRRWIAERESSAKRTQAQDLERTPLMDGVTED